MKNSVTNIKVRSHCTFLSLLPPSSLSYPSLLSPSTFCLVQMREKHFYIHFTHYMSLLPTSIFLTLSYTLPSSLPPFFPCLPPSLLTLLPQLIPPHLFLPFFFLLSSFYLSFFFLSSSFFFLFSSFFSPFFFLFYFLTCIRCYFTITLR